jgi:hypothetical protein
METNRMQRPDDIAGYVREQILDTWRVKPGFDEVNALRELQTWQAKYGLVEARRSLARRREPDHLQCLGVGLATHYGMLKEAAADFLERGEAALDALRRGGADDDLVHDVQSIAFRLIEMVQQMVKVAPPARIMVYKTTAFCEHPERIPPPTPDGTDPRLAPEGLGALGHIGTTMVQLGACLSATTNMLADYPEVTVDELLTLASRLNAPLFDDERNPPKSQIEHSLVADITEVTWRRALVEAVRRFEGIPPSQDGSPL